jgi:hypothetical protein
MITAPVCDPLTEEQGACIDRSTKDFNSRNFQCG